MVAFIVDAPDYREASAGVRSLYILTEALNRLGHRAFITGSHVPSPVHRAPLMPTFMAKAFIQRDDPVVIYPETVVGNPIGARRVARWVLNKPTFLAGDPVFDPSELVFSYSDVYSGYIENPIAGKLYVPTIDQSVYYLDPSIVRDQECFYVGKSTYKDGFFDRAKTREITQTSPTKAEIGDLFRRSKVFYCFDNSTIMTYEAALCGCPVVVIPDGTQTRADFDRLELGMNGIAWGPGELTRAQATVSLMPPFYERAKQDFARQLAEFISLCERRLPRAATPRPSNEIAGLEFENEIEFIFREIDVFEKSRYFKIRAQIKDRSPRIDLAFSRLGEMLFSSLRWVKQTFLNPLGKRKKKIQFESRRAQIRSSRDSI